MAYRWVRTRAGDLSGKAAEKELKKYCGRAKVVQA
jgi:hypothetical protein